MLLIGSAPALGTFRKTKLYTDVAISTYYFLPTYITYIKPSLIIIADFLNANQGSITTIF